MAITIPVVTTYDGKGIERAVRDIANAEGGWNKTRTALSALNGPAMAVGGALAAGAGVAIKAASDMEQAVGGMQAVFGSAQGKIEAFSKTAADSVGLSAAAFDNLATVAGAAFQGMGLSQDEAASKTIEMTQRAADMAAVFGGDVASAMDAMQAGLRGEMDPLEQYGVKLSAAAIQAEALAETGKTQASQLTDQEKSLAAYNLMLDATSSTAGQWAAQQGTAGESMQTMKANLDDAAASLGQTLLPVFSEFVQWLSDAATFIKDNSDVIVPLAAGVGTLAAAIVGFNTALSVYETVTTLASIATTAFDVSLAPLLLTVGAVVLAIAGLVAAGVAIYQNWDTIKAKATEIWGAIKAWLTQTWNSIKEGFAAAWNAIKDAASAIWNAIVSVITGIWEGLKTAVTAYFNFYKSIIMGVWNFIKNATSTVWNGIVGVISGVVNGIRNVLNGIKGIIDRVISWFQMLADRIRSFMSGPINAVKGFVGGLFGGDAPSFADESTVNVMSRSALTVPRLRAAAGSPTGSSSSTVINVQGAVDPEGTARQIRAILDGSTVRNGGQVSRAQSW